MQHQVATASDGTALEIVKGGVSVELFEDGVKVMPPDGEFWPSMREARDAALTRLKDRTGAANEASPGSLGYQPIEWRTE